MKKPVGESSMNKRFGLLVGALAATFIMQPANALVINYDVQRDTALRECDQLRYAQDSAADQCYSNLLGANSMLLRADAYAALGDIRNANKFYREAASQSDDPAIKTSWAELYLATHQVSDATALFREALLYDR